MQMSPPVEENEEFNLKIEALGVKVDGIAKVNGFAIFIPDTKVGDEVKVKIKKVLRNYAFAEKI